MSAQNFVTGKLIPFVFGGANMSFCYFHKTNRLAHKSNSKSAKRDRAPCLFNEKRASDFEKVYKTNNSWLIQKIKFHFLKLSTT